MSISNEQLGVLAPWVRTKVTANEVVLVAGASSFRVTGEPSRVLAEMLNHLLTLAPLALTLASMPAESREVGESLLRYLDSENLILKGGAAEAFENGRLAAFELQKWPSMQVVEPFAQLAWITDKPKSVPSSMLMSAHRLESVVLSTRDAMDAGRSEFQRFVVADDVAHDWRTVWNRYALEHSITWAMFDLWNGITATIGPVFAPHSGPCYECLIRRRQASAGIGSTFDLVLQATKHRIEEPTIDSITSSLLARYLWQWVRLGDDSVIGQQWQVTESSMVPAIDSGRILRVPRCDACSMAGSYQRRTAWRSLDVGGEQ